MKATIFEFLTNLFGGRTKRILDNTQQSMEIIAKSVELQQQLIVNLQEHNRTQDEVTNKWRIEFIKKYDKLKEDLQQSQLRTERLEFFRCEVLECPNRKPPLKVELKEVIEKQEI